MKETQNYFININFLAADTGYGCNTYGAGSYNEDQCTTTTDSGTTSTTTQTAQTTSSSLAPTGTNIALGVGGGLALIVAGSVIILKLQKKLRKNK